MSPPSKKGIGLIVGSLLTIVVIVVVAQRVGKASRNAVVEKSPPSDRLNPGDEQKIRMAAWKVVSASLDQADQERAEGLPRRVDVSLARLNSFMDSKRDGVKPFAEAMIGWSEVWSLAKSQVSNAAQDEHHRRIRETFEARVFSNEEFQQVTEEIVRLFTEELEAEENRFLVEVCKELQGIGPSARQVFETVAEPEQFHRQYRATVPHVAERANRQIRESIDTVLIEMTARKIAIHVAQKLAKGLCLRAGVVAVKIGTFSVGFVASLVVSLALDVILAKIGFDPVASIQQQVNEILDSTILVIKEGNQEAKVAYDEMIRLSQIDPEPDVRESARQTVMVIESGGQLGLRRELFRIANQRATIRRLALSELIQGEDAK